MVVRPPMGKQRKYPALTLSVIHARETTRPKGRERMEWKLLTDLPRVRIGRSVRYDVSDVKRWIDERKESGPR